MKDPSSKDSGDIYLIIGGVIGAIIGFILGGVGGAILGFIIGVILIGGFLFSLLEEGGIYIIGCILVLFIIIVGFIWLIVALWNVGK